MSDQGEEDGVDAQSAEPVRGEGANPTMQVDALVDPDAVLEDSSAGGEEAPEFSDGALDAAPVMSHAPPPLPKRGPKKAVVVAALVVVLALSVGAAVAASSLLAPALPAPVAARPRAPTRPAAPPARPVVAEPIAEAPHARAPITIEAIEITGGSLEEDAGPE